MSFHVIHKLETSIEQISEKQTLSLTSMSQRRSSNLGLKKMQKS